MPTIEAMAAQFEALQTRCAELEARCRALEDRQAVQDVLCRFSRALDRLDIELLRSVFWPEAHVDLGPGLYQGQARDLYDFAMEFQGAMQVTRHELSNVLMEPAGADRVFVESYVYAFHAMEQNGEVQDLIVYGRYLDELERRDGEWRIAKRTELLDWAHERPATADWFDRQPPLNRGKHSTADEFYTLRPR